MVQIGYCGSIEEALARQQQIAKRIVDQTIYTQPINVLDIYQKSCNSQCGNFLGTGDIVLDRFLGGGITVPSVLDLAGASSTGKTQLCLQLSLTCQLPYTNRGLQGGKMLFCFNLEITYGLIRHSLHLHGVSFSHEEILAITKSLSLPL